MLTLGLLNNYTNVRHAFFTRIGGVSTGLYATLNTSFGSRDDPENVARNRAIALEMMNLPPGALVTGYQEHGTRVATADAPWAHDEAPRADGLVTRTRRIALGVLTADCAPVLLADPEAGVVGAAHAGWRGAKAGIVQAVIRRMAELGAEPGRIKAAIGPCIAHRSYEVGPEFPERILGRPLGPEPGADEAPGDHDLFAPARRRGHYLFDLPGYVQRQCGAAGVTDVAATPCDTFQEEDRFYSYRRATLRGEPDYGRCLSAIVLES